MRAFLALGEASRPVLEQAAATGAFAVRVHAGTASRLLDDPERGYLSAEGEARQAVLGGGGAAAQDP